MAFPQTMSELKLANYRFLSHAKCQGEDCGREVEYYLTPRGRRIPLEVMPLASSPVVPHWSSCPNADDFRRDRK